MENRKIMLVIALLITLFIPSVFAGKREAGQTESFKNLAGSAEEMAAMRLPAPETLGIRSKAAMLPLHFARDKAGNAVWQSDLPLENTEDLRFSLLAPNSRNWQINAKAADGEQIDFRQSALVETQPSEVGFDGVNYPAEVFTFENAKSGNWRITINAGNSAKIGETVGYLIVSSKSPYRLYSYLNGYETLVGRNLEFITEVFEDSAENEKGVPAALSQSVKSAEIEFRAPSGKTEKLNFDSQENGQFRVNFVPREVGEYTAQVLVRGITADNTEFVRTSEHIFQVLADNVKLGNAVGTSIIDENRLRVNIPAFGLREGRKVIAYGEIWAQNASGEKSPVAWLSGMVIAETAKNRTTVPMVFDARWLARSDAKSGYELRNVRLQDADYFVSLAAADSIPLTINNLPENARNSSGEITDEMRTGKKPENLISTQAAGGKLMLVHGYCSSDVWAAARNAGNFSNYVTFQDFNQNRSHDQFAQRILSFGASLPSYGIVAHSQGGAASLHLYTYYWSGLDAATGNRLIQSVGSPYQGTALAGNLAVLGQVFGAGCGSNYDLTYSGSAAWLAGIPGWARAKVNYSTTSFEDVWWRYDYCSLATDLFLGDPEDGVTEKAYGQLPGAINRGHKTGWCHTSGMRDPAQTSDSSRNTEMNANAAR